MKHKEEEKELARLSASRIKTLGECSYYYFSRYHLKLPDKTNSGAMRGTVCHALFEILTKKKYLGLALKLHESGCDIPSFKVISRFIRAQCNKIHLEMQEVDKKSGQTNIEMIYDMIAVGLASGFFPTADEEIIDSEYAFDITDEALKFRMIGFIDKILYDKKNECLWISDYKSSKVQFKGDDLETNLQAMMYVLAAHYLKKDGKIPNFKKVIGRFIFLRFASKPFQELEFTEDQIEGFKHYLSYINTIIANFDENDAKLDYAAKDPARRWKCSTKSGWKCAYKDGFDYYALVDSKNAIKRTVYEEDYLQTEQFLITADGEMWEKKRYNGCPAHVFVDDGNHFDF